ncbi:unnamed protein product [Menidia menidia]|uniref:(Atlantic silverside) hypothetical protein n=1 Tax=Menidia menidia TaxID=238744 RepID=A0A8S4BJI9_9TELE|nr:unnamed protein product [Menidia menidia]
MVWVPTPQKRKWTVDEFLEDEHLSPAPSIGSECSLSPVYAEPLTRFGTAVSPIMSPDGRSLSSSPFTPSPPPPPPRRRASRIPLLIVKNNRDVKEVANGCRLQTAEAQFGAFEKRLRGLQWQLLAPVPEHPETPREIPALEKKPPLFKPSPPPKKTTSQTTVRTRKTTRTNVMKKTQTVKMQESKDQEELEPLTKPAASLSEFFAQIVSEEWEKKIEALRWVRALAQHHQNVLLGKLHEVCLAVMEEVHNLRSSVACAAIDTMASLYTNLQKNMDNEVERTGRCLILRIAQATVNTFVQQQVNLALAALVHNCSPGRVLTVLLHIGVGHLSPAVRASTGQQLQLMADKMGAEAVLTTGQSFTPRFLTAVSKLSVDAAAEVRCRGQAAIQILAKHQDFMKLWLQSVHEKDQRFLQKIVMNACRK